MPTPLATGNLPKAMRELSCNALVNLAHSGRTNPPSTRKEVEAAREELDRRECEGHCPCATCDQEEQG